MNEWEQITITLPKEIVNKMDELAKNLEVERSRIVVSALESYIMQKKSSENRKKMIKGYIEMGTINLELANDALNADNEVNQYYEEILAECE